MPFYQLNQLGPSQVFLRRNQQKQVLPNREQILPKKSSKKNTFAIVYL